MTAERTLLHPQTSGTVDESMVVQGRRIGFKMIDMSNTPPRFEKSLSDLALRGWARGRKGRRAAFKRCSIAPAESLG